MSPAAISSLLISSHGVGFVVGVGGGAIVGFTGRVMGGGLGIGRLLSARGRCGWVPCVGVGAEFLC